MITLNLVRRSAFGWPALSDSVPHVDTDQGMVGHYDGEQKLLPKVALREHDACVTYWKQTRQFHMNGHRWTDIGYAYMVCPCGFILEGRGYGRQQAAELPTPGKLQNGNSRYISVTFGLGPGEHPTEAQLEAWHELRDWLMESHGVASAVHGHRDFTSTDCPGDVIYGLVKDGTLSGKGRSEDMKMPVLRKGSAVGPDVLTLRGVLFQRFLADRWAEDSTTLFQWLRSWNFDDDLEKDVKAYQTWRKLEADGVVGPVTWSNLTRAV